MLKHSSAQFFTSSISLFRVHAVPLLCLNSNNHSFLTNSSHLFRVACLPVVLMRQRACSLVVCAIL